MSTIATVTSSSASPTPSTQGSSSGQSSSSSSLYLFTFLATLLLLLAVSCAIVVRSFILRRRFRRRIEEAIAAGVLVPGSLDEGGVGRRRRDFGEKPKLWDVWVDEHGHFHDGSSDNGYDLKDEGKWEHILPVAASMVPINDSKTYAFGEGDHANPRSAFSRMLTRRPGVPPTPQEESIAELGAMPASSPSVKEDGLLQVSVLISMPNPNAKRMHSSDGEGSFKGKDRGSGYDDHDGDEELPHVVFGVAEVNVRP
ncbi:hypothetical protein M422DRAFT_30607 [Sphaerobolus stellatus SS14]|uniref:Uncharacterized protein n=1 Tax=Sphaerobolus stellatus (strain SS14) TaxID=990650 RepID=A0A0C9VAS9_SPHS4|nr:hypothetical protein M422DRAFT_30607 [Sphaerobolus stellatus SS14]